MKINIDVKTTNIEMTKAIGDYLNKRLAKLERFVARDVSAHAQVEIGTTTSGQHSGDIFRAEINLQMDGEKFRAEAIENDLYSAIDEAKDEMVRILRSHKGKRQTMMKRGGTAIKNMLKGFRR